MCHSISRSLAVFTLLTATWLVACSGDTDNKPRPDTGEPSDMSTSDVGDDTTVDATDDTTTSADTSDPDTTTETCTEPAADCDGDAANGCETDLDSAPAHCGACGNACAASEVCSAGQCSSECAGGLTNCDGACVDTATSVDHCGSCDTACTATNASPACTAGSCGVGTCLDGFGDCDSDSANGCETELGSTNHCGACGDTCAGGTNASPACDATAGTCSLTCLDGFGDCDASAGCETPIDSDANCGACGVTCGDVAQGVSACVDQACQIQSCEAGFVDVDLDPFNGCEASFSNQSLNLPFGLRTRPGVFQTMGGLPGTSLMLAYANNAAMLLEVSTFSMTRDTLSLPDLSSSPAAAAAWADVGAVFGSNRVQFVEVEGFNNDTLAPLGQTVNCEACLAQDKLRGHVRLLQPPGESEPRPHLFVGDGDDVAWIAYSTADFGVVADPGRCPVDPMQSYSICTIEQLNQTAQPRGLALDFDLFEHGAQTWLAVLVGDSAQTSFVDIYRVDLEQPALVRVTPDAGLPSGLGDHGFQGSLAVVPGSDTLAPGLILAAGSDVSVLRFGSGDVPDTATLESQLTVTDLDVVDVVALDDEFMVVAGSREPDGGRLFGLRSSPTHSATGARLLLELDEMDTSLELLVKDEKPADSPTSDITFYMVNAPDLVRGQFTPPM